MEIYNYLKSKIEYVLIAVVVIGAFIIGYLMLCDGECTAKTKEVNLELKSGGIDVDLGTNTNYAGSA